MVTPPISLLLHLLSSIPMRRLLLKEITSSPTPTHTHTHTHTNLYIHFKQGHNDLSSFWILLHIQIYSLYLHIRIHNPFPPIKLETQAGFFFISNQQKAMFNKMLTLSPILCQLFPRVSRSREASIGE